VTRAKALVITLVYPHDSAKSQKLGIEVPKPTVNIDDIRRKYHKTKKEE